VAIGASERPRSVGAAVTRNLLDGGFAGEIHLVNRKGGEIAGRPVWRSLSELLSPPDLAVVMTPAEPCRDPQGAGAKGTKAAVIISAGRARGRRPRGNARWRQKLLAPPAAPDAAGRSQLHRLRRAALGLNASFGRAR
jgi:acetyltransferase